MTINNSTFTIAGEFGQRSTSGGEAGGTVNLNNSDLTAQEFYVGSNSFLLNIGSAAGDSSASFSGGWDSNSSGDQGFTVNFYNDVGNSMSMTTPGRALSLATGSWTAAQWAEGLWENNQITYGGADSSTLGDWSTVTTTGLGNGNLFTFDGNTLAVAAIPEPSTLALVSLAFTSIFYFRRRK